MTSLPALDLPALDDFLDRAGLPVTAEALLSALAQIGAQRLVGTSASSAAHNDEETAVLARHSGVDPRPGAADRMRARTAAKSVLLYSGALSTNQVAEQIGRSPSRVRHLARERRLYTLPVDRRGGLLFPAWQFTDSGQPLPGLAAVLRALPAGLHPLQVVGFFTTPSMELSLDDETPLAPLEWLRDGGDEATVAALAAAHDEIT